MANQQNLKISGMLNQHEFIERYVFTKQRVMNGFTRPDLAFLLGRIPNDVADYEHFGAHVKMSYQDHEVMAAVFKKLAPTTPIFQARANDIDISNDKRMIRGTVLETDAQRVYDFIHPWKIKGEDKPITIVEELDRDMTQDAMIRAFVEEHLAQLKAQGCFEHGCTALFLYQQLSGLICKSWQPLFLKILRVSIYARIHAQEIRVHQVNGQTIYKTKP
ncbi:hypothetical protein [Pedobacter sp. GR22-6]|uniref:hypothetical protein n=1 Tax=Pedobacter sp. GR22-6 TaxID=3127957 RepID=UPI00307CCE6C